MDLGESGQGPGNGSRTFGLSPKDENEQNKNKYVNRTYTRQNNERKIFNTKRH